MSVTDTYFTIVLTHNYLYYNLFYAWSAMSVN